MNGEGIDTFGKEMSGEETETLGTASKRKGKEVKKLNEIQKDMRTPIEIALGVDENGMTTAKKLYDFLELNPGNYARWCKSNITENEFAEENIDFTPFFINEECGGQATTDYKLTAHFAKKLSCKGNGERAEQAREYFTTIEERIKQKAIDLEQLDPQTKLMNLLVQSISRNELEQKRLAKEVEEVKQTQAVIEQKQEVISETFQKADDIEDFQKWAKNCISKIAESPKFDKGHGRSQNYSFAYAESYDRLKQKRNCRLDDRVQKAVGRALEQQPDIRKSELQKISKIYVIANDKDLRLAYELVIKEMMIYYCVA